jgi:phenylpropionate dioxygenase-like ring-hydroxylating dioxygenase large terminal subunit
MEHWNLPGHGYTGSQVLHADINWKLAIDTFGENYHFDVLHRETLSKEIHGNLQTNDIFDLNYRMVFAYHHFKEIVANVPEQSNWPFRSMTLCVYFIYPNAILLVDPYSVDVLRMFPDNDQPGKSRTAQSFYIVPEAEEHFQDGGEACAQRFAGFNQVVLEEDYLVGESTQRGALSGANTHLVFGRNEPALHHYHNAHRRGLGKPLLEVETA